MKLHLSQIMMLNSSLTIDDEDKTKLINIELPIRSRVTGKITTPVELEGDEEQWERFINKIKKQLIKANDKENN